jgi:hypothetical protein
VVAVVAVVARPVVRRHGKSQEHLKINIAPCMQDGFCARFMMNLEEGFFWWNRLDFIFDARPALAQFIGHQKLKRRP